MLCSAYDNQCDCYFHSGRNSESRSECVLAIWQFLIEGWDDEEIEKIPIGEVLECSEVEIHEHKESLGDG